MNEPVQDSLSDATRDLLLVRDGRDRAAFARLFDWFAPRLKAMLLRGGLRDGSAEDVVQDVMLAVWHKAAQFDPHRADAAGWIYGIARNRRIDLARRRPLSQPGDMPEVESLEPDVAQILALQQEARHLAEALSRLAPEQAEALRAAYFDDLPHSHISAMTGLPLGTIKSRIRLGLDRLRHETEKDCPMTEINHHIPDDVLATYRAGTLGHAFAVVVAAHLSICDACRARAETEDMLGGALLDQSEGVALRAGARDRMLAALDAPPPPRQPRGSGVFPAPVMVELDGQPPRWRMLGAGIRQQILSADREGSLRLLYIPPGKAVPEHGHRGLELTLVLQGSFSDSEGSFQRGDVETTHETVHHQPIAGPGLPCICLAATDAPLRFHGLVPRLLQPLFRI